MAKINNTSTFPIVASADIANDDILIGTDVSDTTNDAAGETKNFRVGDIRGGITLITSATISSATATVDITDFIDSSTYNSYFFYFDSLRVSGTANNYSIRLQGSNDGFSTSEWFTNLVGAFNGAGNATPEQAAGYLELGNLGIGSFNSTGQSLTTLVSDGSRVTTGGITLNANGDAIDALRIVEATGAEDITNLNYYVYGLRNT